MLEGLIVAIVVLAASAYAAWALMPVSARLQLARTVAGIAGGPAAPPWLGRLAARLERAALRRGGGQCAACDARPAAPDRRPPAGG